MIPVFHYCLPLPLRVRRQRGVSRGELSGAPLGIRFVRSPGWADPAHNRPPEHAERRISLPRILPRRSLLRPRMSEVAELFGLRPVRRCRARLPRSPKKKCYKIPTAAGSSTAPISLPHSHSRTTLSACCAHARTRPMIRLSTAQPSVPRPIVDLEETSRAAYCQSV